MKINSQISLGSVMAEFPQDMIKREPMMFRADRDFAILNGGPITKLFLWDLGWDHAIVDSRVHMLMPGMYPCIPGWHHDDVPRSRSDGQPNYINPEYRAEHCMALFGDCSLTQFATGEHDFLIPDVGHKIYKELSPYVEHLCVNEKLKRVTSPDRTLIFFDWLSWHRGAETTKTGFRFFIRATRGSHLTALNEIRHNANVYMPILEEGW